MNQKVNSVQEYVNALDPDRKEVIERMRQVIKATLPKGFDETISYNMIGYVVPHEIYPKGYHCDPKLPLPFISIASQKNFVALYHMGIYANEEMLHWFVEQYPLHSKLKLDMGKSCIRFKKMNDIPYELIGELCSKMTPVQWVQTYEAAFVKK
jgi:uncharacterized protein YdhG (YjbR/CyaY superfamily)